MNPHRPAAHPLQRALRHALRDESGAQIVDFALCSFVFFMIVLATVDVCRAGYAYHIVTYGAQRATRYAIVRGSSWNTACATTAPPHFTMSFACKASSADVQNYVRNLGGFDPSRVTVTTTWPGTTPTCGSNCSACTTTNKKGCMVKVKVTYAFTFVVPFFKQGTVNLSANSQKVIQQ